MKIRVLAFPFIALGGCAPPIEATRFIAVPDPPELDRHDAYQDENGVMRDRAGKEVPDRCVERCAFAVPKGRRVVRCHAARASEEILRAVRMPAKELLLCEIR